MKNYRFLGYLIVCIATLGLMLTPALATERNDVCGYVYNTETGELKAYEESPSEVLPAIQIESQDMSPYIVNFPVTRSIGRVFVSYSPSKYTYEYENPMYKIGRVRVDNSGNKHNPAELIFTVDKSSSCGVEYSASVEYGGEVNAIFSKAELKFGASIAYDVSWTKGTSVSTNSSVPPGMIGSVTAYVIGVYSQGTATYRLLNTTTDETWLENVGIGALIPTTNEWNLVVEIPSA